MTDRAETLVWAVLGFCLILTAVSLVEWWRQNR